MFRVRKKKEKKYIFLLYTVYNVLRAGLRVVKLLEQPSSLSVFSSKAVRKLQRQFKEEKTKTMSLPRLSEAERKFWRTPDLLERLLAVLDAKSVLALVKGLPPALAIIQRKPTWIKLVKRVCSNIEDPRFDSVSYSLQQVAAEHRSGLIPLVGILKRMTSNFRPRLLDLLDVICDGNPPVLRENVSEECSSYLENNSTEYDFPGPELIKVTCTRHTSHEVSPYGFLLLETVEGAMDTTMQMVEQVALYHLKKPWFTGLQARLLRQEDLGVDVRVEVLAILLRTIEDALALPTLVQHCYTLDIRDLVILADVGQEGWAALAEALSGKEVFQINSDSPNCMASARREDLRDIWEHLQLDGSSCWTVRLDDEWPSRFQEFEDWASFEKFLDGEETDVPIQVVGDSSSEEEEEEEEEEGV